MLRPSRGQRPGWAGQALPLRGLIPCTRFDVTRHASSNADVSRVERTPPGYPTLNPEEPKKENIKPTGKMDYPDRDIYMNLDSSAQLSGLHACEKEPKTVEWIETYRRPGDVLCDIGANVGAYSFVAYAVTGGSYLIYAFEPSFTSFAALSQNILLDGYQETIIPLHVALTHETELIPLNYSSIVPGASLHYLGEAIDETGHSFQPVFTQPILSYRLDDLVRQFPLKPANHIKIDVDGGGLVWCVGLEKHWRSPNCVQSLSR